jgi:DNA-binding XRE family transcriptional regulator
MQGILCKITLEGRSERRFSMNREEIIIKVSDKLRLIRTEAGYTQDKMAEIIGVSKKTLVQIEKGRVLAGWSTVVSICALFRETETVQFLFGNEPLEVLETVAREGIDYRKMKTLGGRIWWKELSRKNGYILQQNIVSKHFRILDEKKYRIYSSLDEKQAKTRFKEITKKE